MSTFPSSMSTSTHFLLFHSSPSTYFPQTIQNKNPLCLAYTIHTYSISFSTFILSCLSKILSTPLSPFLKPLLFFLHIVHFIIINFTYRRIHKQNHIYILLYLIHFSYVLHNNPWRGLRSSHSCPNSHTFPFVAIIQTLAQNFFQKHDKEMFPACPFQSKFQFQITVLSISHTV